MTSAERLQKWRAKYAKPGKRAQHEAELEARIRDLEALLILERRKGQSQAQVTKPKRRLTEQEVVMYGVTLWPIKGNQFGEYDYDQLSTAIWSFNDLDTWIQPDQSPESRAICIRHSTRWLTEFVRRNLPDEESWRMRKVYGLISALATLMSTNPTGECRAPPSPKIEGGSV
jgi:hypothetical protein